MIALIKNFFTRPTAQTWAARRLEEHQRELIEARRTHQMALATVGYHERVIADLERTLGGK